MIAPGHLPAGVSAAWRRLGAVSAAEGQTFDPAQLDGLPLPVARWLAHSIDPGARLFDGAHLSMHGQIRVKQWMPFTARQVLAPDGFIWAARAGRFPVTISGFDRFYDGAGEMHWRAARIVKVMSAADDDTTRSAAGRLAAETMLLPAAALRTGIDWSTIDEVHACARVTVGRWTHDVTVEVDEIGRLRSVSLPRWGSPDGAAPAEHCFGVDMTGELVVDGHRLPAAMRAGWWHGRDRWDEGEFYRAELGDVGLFCAARR